MKICSYCHKKKGEAEFGICRTSKSGTQSRCKVCNRVTARIAYRYPLKGNVHHSRPNARGMGRNYPENVKRRGDIGYGVSA